MKKFIKTAAIGLFVLIAPYSGIAAASYPDKPIKLVVPFPPGGGTDIMARTLAAQLTDSLKQSVVVENKPGAGGMIGTDYVARSNPDGYTIMIGSISTISIGPSLYKDRPVNPLTDLVPVAPIASTPSLLVVPASLNISSVKELVDLANSKDGTINFASAGPGTSHHLGGELFKIKTGVNATHVPYKGTSPAILGVIRNDAQFLIANLPSLQSSLDGDKIKPIAVTSLTRSPQLPDLPTMDESGYPGFEVVVWYGIFAPKGTPADIVDTLNKAIVSAVQTKSVADKLIADGAQPMIATPKEFATRIQNDYETWKEVVEIAGVKLD